MQYPIIDTLTTAYLNNGWTGLDIYNLFPIFSKNATGNESYNITYKPNIYGVTGTGVPTWGPIGPFRLLFLSQDDYNTYIDKNLKIKIFTDSEYVTLTDQYVSPDRSVVISGNYIQTTEIITINFYIMIYSGEEPIRYNYNVSDFPNRLKLPLPHYFPHPVIDALQRAAAGTQTSDDTEILRHYLTPLGIGGI